MSAHHPIMLCQPDAHKSCSACCGLYNWVDHSRSALTAIVDAQTELFFALTTYDNLDNYRNQRNRKINNTKLFETIYNCEFVGYIDSEHKKVGCMLHPAVTGNPELRNHCFYGSKVCNEHFCPGFSCLTTPEQRAVVATVHDWYLYGLVITDIDLVKEFFKNVENTIGESIKVSRLDTPKIHAALTDFFTLKEHWKFQAKENRLGKYYFSKAEYNIARIEYTQKWGIPPSPFDKILISLESDFATKEELEEAETIIQDKITAFIDAYNRQV